MLFAPKFSLTAAPDRRSRNRRGACLAGDTMVIHAGSGWPVTLRYLVDKRDGVVLTLREAGIIACQRPRAYVAHEPTQLYRLTTAGGRTIEATADHPFLTRDGWTPLTELVAAERVAVVVEYPELFGRADTDGDLLKLLAAYLTANGANGDGATPPISDLEVRLDCEGAAAAKGDVCVELGESGATHLRVCGRDGVLGKAGCYLPFIGVHGVSGVDTTVPDFVFGLRREKLRLFLNRMFTCDGVPERSGRISWSSPSMRMARQVQHLLARFGISAAVRAADLSGDGARAGAELWIDSKLDVVRFIDQIGFVGDKAIQAEWVRASLYDIRDTDAARDRLGPILFDPIHSVEATEIAPVYDLTIEGSHNFIASDFVVHNSSSCGDTDANRRRAQRWRSASGAGKLS